jgi:hypothetical protein
MSMHSGCHTEAVPMNTGADGMERRFGVAFADVLKQRQAYMPTTCVEPKVSSQLL